MSKNTPLPSWAPKCPNHGATLEGLPFPMTAKGTGICPVSGCPFDYEVDLGTQEQEEVQDKFDNKVAILKLLEVSNLALEEEYQK